MAQADDLCGFGMPPQLAAALSGNANTLTCTGTTQATAATILSKFTELSPASSQTGAILPNALIAGEWHVVNQQSTSAVVYVPVGDTLNTTLNGSLTVAQGKAAILWKYKVSGGAATWTYILTA